MAKMETENRTGLFRGAVIGLLVGLMVLSGMIVGYLNNAREGTDPLSVVVYTPTATAVPVPTYTPTSVADTDYETPMRMSPIALTPTPEPTPTVEPVPTSTPIVIVKYVPQVHVATPTPRPPFISEYWGHPVVMSDCNAYDREVWIRNQKPDPVQASAYRVEINGQWQQFPPNEIRHGYSTYLIFDWTFREGDYASLWKEDEYINKAKCGWHE